MPNLMKRYKISDQFLVSPRHSETNDILRHEDAEAIPESADDERLFTDLNRLTAALTPRTQRKPDVELHARAPGHLREAVSPVYDAKYTLDHRFGV